MADLTSLISWFQSHNGYIDLSSVALTTYPQNEGGRGMCALKDIPEGHTLFTIPRSLSLSQYNSSLPQLYGLEEWKNSGSLKKGWVGLILVMMWEAARGTESTWSEYLASLPTTFNTPMFWDACELEELRGTSVVEKIGREDVERDYQERLLPVIRTRPDLFPPELIDSHYSLEQYHIMGSRILSRSFNVEKPDSGEEDSEAAHESHGGDMDLDYDPSTAQVSNNAEDDETEMHNSEPDTDGEGEGEDEVEVCMLPMADMLNARYGSENAKLFYQKHTLEMISTRAIKAGEQIWNTYGNLPNAELLRRYGHVDLLPLSEGGKGNPGDVVEMGANLVVDTVSQRGEGISRADLGERVDWWLEEGGDDVFVFEFDFELPPALVSFVRLMTIPQDDWAKARTKGKVPKPKVDAVVLQIVNEVLGRRIGLYPTSREEDEKMLREEGLLANRRHAIAVRIGEKRILEGVMEKVRLLVSATGEQAKRDAVNKRKGHDAFNGEAKEPQSRSKKSRR